jgi:HlyD family secretion protein
MNPNRIWKYTGIIFLSSVGWLLSGCYNSREGNALNVNAVIPAVEALQARQGSLPLTERLTGVVKAGNQVAIYPEINAVITEVLVKNGQVVDRGQPLVRLRDKEFREQRKQCRQPTRWRRRKPDRLRRS